jgi:HSP20 family protein
MVPKDTQKTMRHQINIKGSQANSGQMSERMGQQASDVQVHTGGEQEMAQGQTNGNSYSNSTQAQPSESMNA